jgi:hypothetical protein
LWIYALAAACLHQQVPKSMSAATSSSSNDHDDALNDTIADQIGNERAAAAAIAALWPI